MGIKQSEKTKNWLVWYGKRNPKTGKLYQLKRYNIKTKVKAKKVEVELIALVHRKIEEVQTPYWHEVIDEYIKASREVGLLESTVHDYQLKLRAHTMPEWEKKLVTEITAKDIRAVISEKLKDRSACQKKNILGFIRSALQFALEEGYIKLNPTPRMTFRHGIKIKKVLTKEQANVFLTKAKQFDSEWYPIWAMAVYTGMRNGELYALTWDKVDLERRILIVDAAWNSKDGFKSTKSGNDRTLEIAPNLVYILKELQLKNGKTGFVLPRMYRWDQGDQARQLRMFLMGIGIPPVRFHDLRATWATIMLGQGIEPIKVMKMGGWENIKTMMIYARKAGIDIKGITDGLDIHNPRIESAKVLSLKCEKK